MNNAFCLFGADAFDALELFARRVIDVDGGEEDRDAIQQKNDHFFEHTKSVFFKRNYTKGNRKKS